MPIAPKGITMKSLLLPFDKVFYLCSNAAKKYSFAPVVIICMHIMQHLWKWLFWLGKTANYDLDTS